MHPAFKDAFVREIQKIAFARTFVQELEKRGFLPMLAAGALVGLGTLGMAAATKPGDMTWRGAGFKPGAIGRHFAEMAVNALPTRFAVPIGTAMSLSAPGPRPLSFAPKAVSSMAVADAGKKLPGGF